MPVINTRQVLHQEYLEHRRQISLLLSIIVGETVDPGEIEVASFRADNGTTARITYKSNGKNKETFVGTR